MPSVKNCVAPTQGESLTPINLDTGQPGAMLTLWYCCAHYEVFAGGTRLAAAQEAGIEEVPIMVYPAADEEYISRLADEDNENDEYHVPVPLPDIWGEYKRLNKQEKWTQQQIAKTKGVNQATVALRQKYADFPNEVIDTFIKNEFLKESHALELSKLLNFNNLTPWFTRDDALIEILTAVLKNHHGKHSKSRYELRQMRSVPLWRRHSRARERACFNHSQSG